MAGQEYRDLPLIAYEVLDDLRADLAAPELFQGYVGRYVEMWPDRCRRLATALDAEDQEALLDAVLSITTSAGMVGAVRLEQVALDIKDTARNGRVESVRSFLEELELCGQLTIEQLRRDLLRGRLPVQGQDGQ